MPTTALPIYTVSHVAAEVGCSPSLIRKLEAEHVIAPAQRTVTGMRRFSAADVEAIRQVVLTRSRVPAVNGGA
jgi:DNA-binding transcriptional MerR regulator